MSATGLIGPASQVVRYYQAGIVNTAVGYGLFAAFLALGMNPYIAQVFGHIIGVVFNYFTYSRHAFRYNGASKAKFLVTYIFNYFLGLATLFLALQYIASPYIAGIIAILFVSIMNYFILKNVVFIERRRG